MPNPLQIKVPAFNGEGPFGMPATGPFSIMALEGQPPSAAVGMTGLKDTKPFHLLLEGQHIAQMAMLLLEFSYKAGIPLPAMPGAKTGWETTLAQDGSKIRLRVFQTSGLQVDLEMTPGDAMKLQDDMEQRCKEWRENFARH